VHVHLTSCLIHVSRWLVPNGPLGWGCGPIEPIMVRGGPEYGEMVGIVWSESHLGW
jgi:hypothetical protein